MCYGGPRLERASGNVDMAETAGFLPGYQPDEQLASKSCGDTRPAGGYLG